MKIAVIGAAGNAGSRIVAEALRRGHDVTAVGPNADKLGTLGITKAVAGDITRPEELAAKLGDVDTIVSAVRFVRYQPVDLLALANVSKGKRLVVVGGAGSLRTGDGNRLLQSPSFPEAAKPEATAGLAVLEALESEQKVDWTMLCPSAMFAPGERTGAYRTGGDQLLTGADGKSRISMEDYAIALLDEIEQPKHRGQRFTVGY